MRNSESTCLCIQRTESESLGSFWIFTNLFTYFVNNKKYSYWKFLIAKFGISILVYLHLLELWQEESIIVDSKVSICSSWTKLRVFCNTSEGRKSASKLWCARSSADHLVLIEKNIYFKLTSREMWISPKIWLNPWSNLGDVRTNKHKNLLLYIMLFGWYPRVYSKFYSIRLLNTYLQNDGTPLILKVNKSKIRGWILIIYPPLPPHPSIHLLIQNFTISV